MARPSQSRAVLWLLQRPCDELRARSAGEVGQANSGEVAPVMVAHTGAHGVGGRFRRVRRRCGRRSPAEPGWSDRARRRSAHAKREEVSQTAVCWTWCNCADSRSAVERPLPLVVGRRPVRLRRAGCPAGRELMSVNWSDARGWSRRGCRGCGPARARQVWGSRDRVWRIARVGVGCNL